jgi:hypothetical protein
MDYSKVVGMNPKYNTFDLSHDKRMSMQMGKIIPVMALDVLPGDKFTIETSHMTRMLPLVAPVMHNVKVKVRYFFSPNRLVWDNWEDFITGPESATDTTEPTHPTITGPSLPSSLFDYMGVSTSNHLGGNSAEVNALPFAHYQFIYNEYFRDQNLQQEVAYSVTDGSNTSNPDLFQLRTVAWKHDRFTSALPFTQKGPEVTLPVLDPNSTVQGIMWKPGARVQDTVYDISQDAPYLGNTENLRANGTTSSLIIQNTGLASIDNTANLLIDQSALNQNAATINELREAFAIQKWLELNARAGNRYTEHIQAHYGVKPQDSRLQRPEEFGGSVANIQFSEVLQTAGTTSTGQDASALGTMGGHAISASGSRKASYYAQEHGWIFALAYVVPETTYYQGIPAKFNKIDRYDYYQPLLAHLGEQPVLNKELYATGGSSDDNTFGYLPIYDEYRHELNSVHGLMKTSLEHWHLGRKFSNAPALNSTFISCDPSERIFAVENDPEQVLAHVYNDVKVQRKVPYYGTPLGV